MAKFYFLSLSMVLVLLMSCDNELSNSETASTEILEGWEISKSNYDFEINPRDLFFVNSEIGFVVSYNGKIYKTTNSGKSWQKLISGTTLHLRSVFFLNKDIGFVSGQAMSGCLDDDCGKGSILLKTVDGGTTWSKLFFEQYTGIYSLKFFDALNGLAIVHTPDIPNSRNHFIARTTDGGSSWNLIDLDIYSPYRDFFYLGNIVYTVGKNQKLFKSKDHGYNWESISIPIPSFSEVGQIYFYNEDLGFIEGVTNIYKTTDGGENWKVVDFPFTSFGVFHFFNEVEGFNVNIVTAYEGGDFPDFKGSIIYHTMNGGQSWTHSDLIDTLSLGLTNFPQRDLGYGINLSEFYTIKKK